MCDYFIDANVEVTNTCRTCANATRYVWHATAFWSPSRIEKKAILLTICCLYPAAPHLVVYLAHCLMRLIFPKPMKILHVHTWLTLSSSYIIVFLCHIKSWVVVLFLFRKNNWDIVRMFQVNLLKAAVNFWNWLKVKSSIDQHFPTNFQSVLSTSKTLYLLLSLSYSLILM